MDSFSYDWRLKVMYQLHELCLGQIKFEFENGTLNILAHSTITGKIRKFMLRRFSDPSIYIKFPISIDPQNYVQRLINEDVFILIIDHPDQITRYSIIELENLSEKFHWLVAGSDSNKNRIDLNTTSSLCNTGYFGTHAVEPISDLFGNTPGLSSTLLKMLE